MDLAKDTEKKSDWPSKVPGVDHEGLAALREARRDRETANEEQAVSEMTPPDEESGPPVSLETDTADTSFFPETDQGQDMAILAVVLLIVLLGCIAAWVTNYMNT